MLGGLPEKLPPAMERPPLMERAPVLGGLPEKLPRALLRSHSMGGLPERQAPSMSEMYPTPFRGRAVLAASRGATFHGLSSSAIGESLSMPSAPSPPPGPAVTESYPPPFSVRSASFRGRAASINLAPIEDSPVEGPAAAPASSGTLPSSATSRAASVEGFFDIYRSRSASLGGFSVDPPGTHTQPLLHDSSAAAAGNDSDGSHNHDATRAALMDGTLDEATLQRLDRPPTMTIYVASTLYDLYAERNYWKLNLWPRIKELCEKRGLGFELVDLKWGVTDVMTFDHATNEVCMAEVARCCERTAEGAAAFLLVSSECYGWCALPPRVPASEMATLLAHVPASSTKARDVVESWYKIDKNALPEPMAVLRSMREVKDDMSAPAREYFGPGNAEEIISTVLREAAVAAELPQARLDEWNLSVTHREFRAATDKSVNPHAPDNVFIFQRTLFGLRDAAEQAGDDSEDQLLAEYFAPPVDMKKLDAFRAEALKAGGHRPPPPVSARRPFAANAVSGSFGSSAVSAGGGGAGQGGGPTRLVSTRHPWRNRALDASLPNDAAYMRKLTEELFTALARTVEAAVIDHRALDDLEREAAAHGLMAAQRASVFEGRAELKAAAVAMLTPPMGIASGQLKVISGPSGAGKTTLLASAVVEGSKRGVVTIVRFCGATSVAANARSLLRSVIAQIHFAYGLICEELPTSLDALSTLWVRLMGECATERHPLRIALDSLDQLSNAGGGRSNVWGWLPLQLPPHVTLVVSTIHLPEEKFSIYLQLRSKLAPSAFLPVAKLPPAEARTFLATLLARRGRCLTNEQTDALMATTGGGDVSAMHLRLLAGMASKWRSFDRAPHDIPNSVEGLLDNFFARLEAEHGELLVRLLMGLLALCGSGLSVNVLLDAVAGSDEVLGELGAEGTVFEFLEPPVRRCPSLVLARVRAALVDFVGWRTGAGGDTVVAFRHRAFLEAAEVRYLAGPSHAPERAKLLALLADLFSGALAVRFPDRKISPHTREVTIKKLPRAGEAIVRKWRSMEAVAVLPMALLGLGELGSAFARPKVLAHLLCDLDFVAACAHDGRVTELLAALTSTSDQLRAVCRNSGEPTASRWAATSLLSELESIRRWLRLSAPVISHGRDYMVYVDALSTPAGCTAERAARTLAASGLDLSGCWARVDKGRPAAFPPCVAILEGHSDSVWGVALSHDGRLVASASGDKTVRLWAEETGESVAILVGHTARVNAVAFSPESRKVASGSDDKTVRLWSVATNEVLLKLVGHFERVTSVAFSADGRTIASGSADTTVKVRAARRGVQGCCRCCCCCFKLRFNRG